MAQLKVYKGDYYLWDYVPSLVASITFCILFFLITIAHSWRMIRNKLWFCIPFVTGGILMVFGFAFRSISYDRTNSLPLYILQSTFLVLPPAFFAATLYMSYTRLLRSLPPSTVEACSLLTPRWSTRIFLIADFTCINVQGSGAGLLPSGSEAAKKAGQWILVGGLVLHIAVSGCFIIICAIFHHRYKRFLGRNGSSERGGKEGEVAWKSILGMLYATAAVILLRNVFRAVEYVMGREGYLMANEWPIYAMDLGPMVVVMVAFWIWYPGDLKTERGDEMELGSRGGSAEEPLHRVKEDGRGQ